jgi:dipeptidyl-peptidase-4
MAADPSLSFPRLQARTARFTLGRPRGFTVSGDRERVVFLRSRGGDDRATCLWVYDVASATERLVADPVALLSGSPGVETDAERARRERAREQAAGIVGYSLDQDARLAAFVLAGRMFVADLVKPGPAAEVAVDAVRPITTAGPVFDPRLDPTGRLIGYASDGTLRITTVDPRANDGDPQANDGGPQAPDGDRLLIAEPDVRWGVAEFMAAEEMGRQRGFWWAPDGTGLLAARVDESPVQTWYIGDPANPSREPSVVRYPSAGTANADVSLAYLGLDGSRRDVEWDHQAFPYLVSVRWPRGFAPLLTVSSRDQRTMRVLDIDIATGSTQLLREDTDAHWVDITPGVPDRLSDGRLVWVTAIDDTNRLVIGSETVTPVGLQVNAVLAVSGTDVLVSASTESTEQHLWHVASVEQRAGVETSCERLTTEPGVHTGASAGNVLVRVSATLTRDGVKAVVSRGGTEIGEIASRATPAPFNPNVSISRQGPRELRTALVLPQGHGGRPLPVLMDPYGGPHALRVLATRGAYLNAQWLADQGFAVVIVDGRGTPGRGPAWEREVAGDLATGVLQDQVDALQSLARDRPELDLARVAIRGWSFGGYLAALAVLRRPDVFHAAVAGAPVTDWRLYDTHYTERYLGVDASAASYDENSLLRDAAKLERPLMIVHGLADDNVVVAHTLALSSALLAAGRAHTVLPLSGVTHMTSQEVVAENLVQLEVSFLKEALGIKEALGTN